MTMKILYRRERKIGWRAGQALRNARIRARWDELDGFVFDGDDYDKDDAPGETIYASGPIRLLIEPDREMYDDSYIDTWTDLRETDRERIRSNLRDRINRDGAWNVVGEFWNGQEWECTDSCCGFVGDDWENSGYDTDIMSATIDAYEAHLALCARTLEAARPDMYAI